MNKVASLKFISFIRQASLFSLPLGMAFGISMLVLIFIKKAIFFEEGAYLIIFLPLIFSLIIGLSVSVLFWLATGEGVRSASKTKNNTNHLIDLSINSEGRAAAAFAYEILLIPLRFFLGYIPALPFIALLLLRK